MYSGEMHIVHPIIKAEYEIGNKSIKSGESLKFKCFLLSEEMIKNPYFILNVYDASGAIIAQWFSNYNECDIKILKGENTFNFELGPVCLSRGKYRISLVVKDPNGIKQLYWSNKEKIIVVESPYFAEASYQIKSVR